MNTTEVSPFKASCGRYDQRELIKRMDVDNVIFCSGTLF